MRCDVFLFSAFGAAIIFIYEWLKYKPKINLIFSYVASFFICSFLSALLNLLLVAHIDYWAFFVLFSCIYTYFIKDIRVLHGIRKGVDKVDTEN